MAPAAIAIATPVARHAWDRLRLERLLTYDEFLENLEEASGEIGALLERLETLADLDVRGDVFTLLQ